MINLLSSHLVDQMNTKNCTLKVDLISGSFSKNGEKD